jgi:hypothetical protein
MSGTVHPEGTFCDSFDFPAPNNLTLHILRDQPVMTLSDYMGHVETWSMG